MFGMFKRPKAEVSKSPELEQAIELGRRFADDTTQLIKEYVGYRLPSIRKNYMAVLRSQLDGIFDQDDIDPRRLARTHMTVFLEQIEQLPQMLAVEIAESYPDTVKMIEELNGPDLSISLEQLVKLETEADLADLFQFGMTTVADEIALINQGMKHGPDRYEGSEELTAVTMRLMGESEPRL